MDYLTIIFIIVEIAIIIYFCLFTKLLKRNSYQHKSEIKTKLYNKLKNISMQNNIPIYYYDDLGSAAGQFCYYRNSKTGKYNFDDAHINILREYDISNEPSVLAHELGHYMSIKEKQDNTEDSADEYALKLCESLLTRAERSALSIFLKAHFTHEYDFLDEQMK